MGESPLDGMTRSEYENYQDELVQLFSVRKLRGSDKKPRHRRTLQERLRSKSLLGRIANKLHGVKND
jgi:hypothetical protein